MNNLTLSRSFPDCWRCPEMSFHFCEITGINFQRIKVFVIHEPIMSRTRVNIYYTQLFDNNYIIVYMIKRTNV